MIQIANSKQFTTAVQRLTRERMKVRRAETHMWEVTNTAKAHTYHVRFIRQDGRLFATCDCPAGLRHHRAPLVCKHLAAAVLTLRGIQEMRRQTAAGSGNE
jgi:uncharacterized Zn finger protein